MSEVDGTDAGPIKQGDVQLITNVQICNNGTTASDTSNRSEAEQLKRDDRLSVEYHLYHYNYILKYFNKAVTVF
jgi:uncharacterized protein YcfL